MPREFGPHTVFAAKFAKTMCGFQKFIFWPHWFFVNKNISILEYHTKNRSRINPMKPIFFVNFIRIDYLLKLTAMIMFVGMPYIYWKKSIPTINCPVLCSLTAKLHPDAYLSGCLFLSEFAGPDNICRDARTARLSRASRQISTNNAICRVQPLSVYWWE